MDQLSNSIQYESFIMRAAKRLGFKGVAWSLRRIYCPVSKEALVLEIGSGGNPYARANVLCDAYVDTVERFYDRLVVDRPMVLARAEQLPFKDDSFDFVIASHVLEHSDEPEKFIAEMERVGKAGYIEVPDAFMERLTNYPFHRLEITDKNGKLLIRKKKAPTQDPELFELFKNKARGVARRWFETNPFNFHIRYYWDKSSGGIQYTILNPEYQFNWKFSEESIISPTNERMSIKTRLHKIALHIFRALLSQGRRNKKLKLEKYLQCLKCGGNVEENKYGYVCMKCNQVYPLVGHKIPNFTK